MTLSVHYQSCYCFQNKLIPFQELKKVENGKVLYCQAMDFLFGFIDSANF